MKEKSFKWLAVMAGLVIFGFLHSQTDFRPGYIIKNSGDTLYGEIDYRGDLLMGKICKFKLREDIFEYTPDSIAAYRFIDSKYYITREVNGLNVFLEYLVKGEVNIYFYRDNTGDHYYLDKENVKLTEIPYEEGIKYTEKGVPYFYRTTRHIGFLSYYMQDAPNFKKKIEEVEKPDHQRLIEIAGDYHKAVCKDEPCIIFEKKEPLFKFNIELVAGLVNYLDVSDLRDVNYEHTGFLLHAWMPRTNEKIFLRTGIYNSSIYFNIPGEKIYKIPLHIEYVYPGEKLKPKGAFGVSFYRPLYFNFSVSLMAGINIQLYKRFFWSTSYDMEFIHGKTFPLVPRDFLSHGFSAGLLVEL